MGTQICCEGSKLFKRSLGKSLSSDKTSVIPLESPEDVLDKTVYTLCNPVSARLVADSSKCKGVWLYRNCHSKTIQRPDVFFQSDGDMPEQVELQIHTLPSHENWATHEYEKLVAAETSLREQRIAGAMQEAGHTFMGIRGRVLWKI